MSVRRLLAVALVVGLAGCVQVQSVESEICMRIAAMPPAAVAALDAQDPHSTLGVLWAQQKSACIAGLPAPGVTPVWTAMIWGQLKVLIPMVLPYLMPLLIGLL